MQIEVVNPGESVWMIANRYGVSVDSIVQVNGLANPQRLTAGQALVIPTDARTHTVQRGESLWLIANRYGVTVQQLIDLNNIATSSVIQAGLVLRLPEREKEVILANAYLQPRNPARDREIISQTAESLTYFSIFQYRVLRTGELSAPNDEAALQEINATDARAMMVVANFEEGTFSPDVARAVITDHAVKQQFITNIVNTMRSKGYRALNVDFENLFPADREGYNQLLRELAAAMHREGWLISTALAPKTSGAQKGSWYEAHDYPTHGQIVDFVIIMTYEWGWSGGPPMAVAPIPQVTDVLEYAVSVIPPSKIVMGVPLYGYDWTLPYAPGNPFARSLSPQAAVEQAVAVGAAIQYDPVSQAPYYRFYDGLGREHIVWFEDARSIQAKFDLIKRFGLLGISYWVLGNAFPQNWALLTDNFTIRKD